jgi:hypothetical protein
LESTEQRIICAHPLARPGEVKTITAGADRLFNICLNIQISPKTVHRTKHVTPSLLMPIGDVGGFQREVRQVSISVMAVAGTSPPPCEVRFGQLIPQLHETSSKCDVVRQACKRLALTMDIQAATRSDIPAIMLIEHMEGYVRLVGRWDAELHASEIENPSTRYLLARHATEAVGFAILQGVGSAQAHRRAECRAGRRLELAAIGPAILLR